MAEELATMEATKMDTSESWIHASDVKAMAGNLYQEVKGYVGRRIEEMKEWAQREIAKGCGQCAGKRRKRYCTEHTRLSHQRMVNLRKKRAHTFDMPGPIAPGETKEYSVPPYLLGRVIEYLQFRPTMDTDGNPMDLRVTIKGEDGVEWAQFSGGKHDQDACCLLEWFDDDCIGYSEGFIVVITHRGAVGDPAMKYAVLDYHYIFPGQKPMKFCNTNWCYPGSRDAEYYDDAC